MPRKRKADGEIARGKGAPRAASRDAGSPGLVRQLSIRKERGTSDAPISSF